MPNFLQHILVFLTTTFTLSMAQPTRSYKSTTTVLASLRINPNQLTGPGISMKKEVYLYSRNSGKFIRIHNNSVDGSGNRSDPNARLVLETTGFNSKVRIRSFNGSRYLCMSGHGSLTVEKKQLASRLDRCEFFQSQYKGYTTYRSKSNSNWYLGVKNDGRPKSAKKTTFKQRSTHFMEL